MPDQGAITQLFAVTAPQVREKKDTYGGKYLVPNGRLAAPYRDMTDDKIAADLWETTRSTVNAYLAGNGLDLLSM